MDSWSARIKHLELVQGVVTRMSVNSATMKRYCVVVVAAAIGLFKHLNDPKIILASVVLVLVFWLLDTRYLQHEKWYRELYNNVRLENPETYPDFRLTISEEIRSKNGITCSILSWATLGLYLPLLVLLIGFWVISND